MRQNHFPEILLCFTSMLLAGCSSDSGTQSAQFLPTLGASSSSTTVEPRTSLSLSWTPTTSNVDGTPTLPGEIIFYRIYFGDSEEKLSQSVDTRGPINEVEMQYSDFSIPNNTDIFFAVTAVNERGIESNLSSISKFNTQ